MLEKKLEEQLKLLRNSAELYDKGKLEEALNIAIRLRVLFYREESIVAQLGQKRTLKLQSTLEDFTKEPTLKNIDIQSSTHFLTSNGQRAFLGNTQKKELLPIMDWLNETITVLENKSFSRLDIIKISAHKDGGAHVEINDKDLQPLIKPFGEFTYQENNKPVKKVIASHHFILLRQIAYEVLHSKELFLLNGLKYEPMEEIKSYNEYLKEADTLTEQEKYYQAIKLYEKAIDVNPDNATFAYNNMGNCLSRIEEIEEAIQAYKKAIEQDYSYVDPLWNLSLIHNRNKRYDLTIDLYEQILKIDPKHRGANHNFRATLNILSDLKDEIIQQYEDYDTNQPKNLTYIDYLAHSLIKHNYIEEANIFLQYSLTVDPDNILHMNNFAYTLFKQKKYREANKVFDDIINLTTDRIDIIINILEFKLTKNFDRYKTLLDYLEKKEKLFYQIFNLCFKLREHQNIDEELERLIENEQQIKLQYDYTEIEKWILKDNLNTQVIILLEKYFYKTTNT
jgi:tetratricopeptide (TPR) repeat protein